MKSHFAAIVVLAAFAALASEPPTRPVFQTPADAVSASIAANAKGDIDAILATQSDGAHRQMAQLIVTMIVQAGPTTVPADEEARREAFLARHGLSDVNPRDGETPEQTADRLLAGMADKRAFLREFGESNLQRRAAKRAATTKPTTTPVRPTLSDVVIAPDGTTAIGKLSRRDSDRSETSMTIKFVNVDGSWLIDNMIFY